MYEVGFLPSSTSSNSSLYANSPNIITIPNQNNRPSTSNIQANSKIYVLLANYQDSIKCSETLHSLITQASSIQSLHFLLLDEILESQLTCFETFCESFPSLCSIASSHVSTLRKDAREYHGRSFSLSMIETFLADSDVVASKDFCLSMDTRMSMVSSWNLRMLSEWTRLENEKGILSTTPFSIDLKDEHDYLSQWMQWMGLAHFEDSSINRMIHFLPPILIPKASKPLLQPFYSEAFHFGRCHHVLNVPSDPYTWNLDTGNEFHRASRWWTSGYDFYAPTQPLLFQHYVTRIYHPFHEITLRRKTLSFSYQFPLLEQYDWMKYPPTSQSTWTIQDQYKWDETFGFGWSNWMERKEQSKRRIRHLLGYDVVPESVLRQFPKEREKYGVGKERSMMEWRGFSKVFMDEKYDSSTNRQFQQTLESIKYIPTKTQRRIWQNQRQKQLRKKKIP